PKITVKVSRNTGGAVEGFGQPPHSPLALSVTAASKRPPRRSFFFLLGNLQGAIVPLFLQSQQFRINLQLRLWITTTKIQTPPDAGTVLPLRFQTGQLRFSGLLQFSLALGVIIFSIYFDNRSGGMVRCQHIAIEETGLNDLRIGILRRH